MLLGRGGSTSRAVFAVAVLACVATDGGAETAARTANSNAPSAASESRAQPIWAPLTNTPIGCPMDRLVNPSQVRAFTWTPCAGVASCEQMVLLPFLEGQYPGGIVEEEAGKTRVILAAGTKQMRMVLFASDDGWLLDAYRAPSGPPKYCTPFAGALRGTHSGVMVGANFDKPPGKLGGLVHALGDPSDPIPFDVTLPFGFGPAGAANIPMAAGRWAWKSSPDRLLSVATADAADLRVVAQARAWDTTSSILAIDSIDTNGSTFMLGAPMVTKEGGVTSIIATTDGKNPPTPYIVSPDGSFYDYAAYAGSHVAWLRGIDAQAVNVYKRVELWASPYDPDPSKLKPFKVDDWPFTSMGQLLGAAGRVAALAGAPADGGIANTTAVWDLSRKVQQIYTLPANHQVAPPYLGLTSTHLWVQASPAPNTPTDMYVRFALGP
jgi:hypothetical protein